VLRWWAIIKDKGQFLAKAKSMIVQDIQRRTVLTRADLNRLISLSPQIDLNPCFLITLQALTETRRIDTLVVPNRGKLPTYPSEALNNIWLINSNPPSSAEVSEERRGFFWLSNSMNLDALVSDNPLSWLVTQSVLFIELLEKYGVPVVAYSPEELREEVER
jgi:hypothetical protein